ncbi:MAG: heparin lyase I family protein [Candidatus Microsaccharimonas sp.]
MAIIEISPVSTQEITTAVVPLSAKITGWVPERVEFLLGNGRVPIAGVYNGTTDAWEASYDSSQPFNGAFSNNPLLEAPYWNHAMALTVRATGIRIEQSAPHWYFVMPFAHTPVSSFAYRSALNFGPPPYNGTVNQFRDYYSAVGASVGESMITLIPDPVVTGRYAVDMRPDATKDISDQPNDVGLRCQFSTQSTITTGDDFYVGMSYYFPADSPVVDHQDRHLNLFQVYGRDTYVNGETYTFRANFVLNLNVRTRADGTQILSDRDVLFSSGNIQNPGLVVPIIYQRITRGKWYDVVVRFRVSTDPRLGFVQAWINDGSSTALKPISYPVAYPGTNDYTKIPFVTVTPWHEGQRTDIQAYGDREDNDLWPNLHVISTAHRMGSSLAAVDPGSYSSGASLPGYWRAQPGIKMKLPNGQYITTQ